MVVYIANVAEGGKIFTSTRKAKLSLLRTIHLLGTTVLTTLLKKKARRMHQLQLLSQSHNKSPLLQVHHKMHLFPSGAEIVEEGEDIILVMVDAVGTEVVMDQDGATLNTPVSLMCIVWMLLH